MVVLYGKESSHVHFVRAFVQAKEMISNIRKLLKTTQTFSTVGLALSMSRL